MDDAPDVLDKLAMHKAREGVGMAAHYRHRAA
jgi:hypothetical protein